MEYVSGLSFADLAKAGPLAPGVAVKLTAEVAKGLHAAHELKDASGNLLNVVHRDVSPHNLFFAYDGHVKILDFGIALMRDREQAVTQVGTVKGKIAYMAPEQLMGKAVDRR
jgi:serine/threonine-protein kinase